MSLQPSVSKPGPSKKRKKAAGDDDDEDEVKVLKGLEGDTVDPSLIIPGGRGARRGRPASARPSAPKPKPQPADSDDSF